MPHPGYLYLPMEISVRELDSRILLAVQAVERGMEVVLGQKWLMERNINAVPPGTWIFKTMSLRDSGIMKKARTAGHRITSIDEEVPGLAEGSGGLTWVSGEAVAQCDNVFCVGQEHMRSMRQKWPEHAHRLTLTGNPRWDYLRPELSSTYAELAAVYKRQHGPFILVNTNIGQTNSAKYRDIEQLTQSYIRRGKLDPKSPESMATWNEYLNFERMNFDAIAKLVPELAARFPYHSIVVRPHPGENIDTYRRLFSGLDQVKVLFEGPAAAWIIASDVLIHTACTTGTEAYALGKPTVSIQTTDSPKYRSMLSSHLSMVVSTVPKAVELSATIMENATVWHSFLSERRPTFERFFSGVSGKLASEVIVEHCISGKGQKPAGESGWRPKLGFLPWWPISSENRRLFPQISAPDIQRRISDVALLLGSPVRPITRRLGDRLVVISPSSHPV